jgi:hypothetical protein
MSTAHGTGGQQATTDLDERAGELASGYGTLALAGEHGALAGRTRIEYVHARLPGAAMGFYSTASDMEPGAVSRSGNNAGAIRRSFRVDGAARGHQHLGYDPC